MNKNTGGISTMAEARRLIASLDLQPYLKKAVAGGKLTKYEAPQAEAEYRHHLLLCWVNKQAQADEFIVPTERADQVWHEHLLDSPKYGPFCNQLYGEYLDHYPGLEKGTVPFNRAMEHTRTIHSSVGGDSGFVPIMYTGCGASTPSKAISESVDAPATPGTSSPAGDGDSGGGASCGGSCGGGCGG